MTNKQKPAQISNLIYVLIFILFYIITYTDLFNLKIGNATPQLLIPAVVAVALFYGEWVGFLVGMVTGVLADCVAARTVCFNMIALMLIGLFVGLLINRYFNLNIFSALILSAASCFIYFFAYWLVFFVFAGIKDSWQYFIYYSLPSAIYSALFILITYLPGRYIKERK